MMAPEISSSKTVHIRLLLLALALAAFMAFIPKPHLRSLHQPWLPSTFNPGFYGYMATYETLKDAHWPVERWQAPLSSLQGTGQVWIFTRTSQGQVTAVTEQECQLLRNWVSQGNTVIFLGPLADWDDCRELLHTMGVFAVESNQTEMSPLSLDPSSEQVEQMIFPAPKSPISIPLTFPQAAIPLNAAFPPNVQNLWVLNDKVYGVELPIQKGKMIWLASPRLLSRGWITKGQNLEAFLQLIQVNGHPPTKIYFDELHNGFTRIPNFSLLITDPGVAFASVLALLGLLALFSSSLTRFGQILPPTSSHPTTSPTEELVDSIATLYYKSRLRKDVLDQLYFDTKHVVCEKLHLPLSSPGLLIHARLTEACPSAPSWKKLSNRFEPTEYNDGLPPTGWIRVAQQLITIQILLP